MNRLIVLLWIAAVSFGRIVDKRPVSPPVAVS